jgi:undecaprenyl-phosphate galactose phosphotransferase/putative colanic acid biosynthesis UDP-glucose lipid carrier transferase
MSNQTSTLERASIDQRTLPIRDRFALPFQFIEPVVLAVDFILLLCASVFAGIGYHWFFLGGIPNTGPYVAIGALAGLNVTTTLAAAGAYKFQTLLNIKRQARVVSVVWICVFLILLGIAFVLKVGEALSRGATLGFFAIGLTGLLVWRDLVARLLANTIANGTFAKQKTMLIGEPALLSESKVLSELRHYGYEPSAVFEINPEESSESDVPRTIQDKLRLAIRAAREQKIGSILLLVRWDHSCWIDSILIALSVLPIPVYLIPDHNVLRYLNRIHCIGSIWTAELKRAPLSKCEQLVKRIIDLIGASAGLLLLSPLLVTAALLIKLESRGPILFSQWRSGFNGRLFQIYKFRSMTVLEDGPVIRQATREDPRCTRVGRWLRRTNIDELPQLLNVLRGEMSLVGPRPHAVAHDSEYERQIATYALRYQLKPGITGWAQLNGYRGETRTLNLMSKRIELDLWYIKNWSLWLDLKILLGTLMTEVWRSRGY